MHLLPEGGSSKAVRCRKADGTCISSADRKAGEGRHIKLFLHSQQDDGTETTSSSGLLVLVSHLKLGIPWADFIHT